jgi:hypothetical protein
MMEDPYIHCIHLFDQSISTHCIHQKKVFGEPYLGVAAAEVFVCACGRAAVEETGSSSIDGSGVESVRWSREQWELGEFWDEKQNDIGWTTIYRFKHISNDS